MIRRPPRSTLFPTRRSSDLRFHRPDVGAVAGVVKVGNHARNLVTRWQALEYVTQLGVDRSAAALIDRKSTRLNSSHANISYAVFCLKKKQYYQPISLHSTTT